MTPRPIGIRPNMAQLCKHVCRNHVLESGATLIRSTVAIPRCYVQRHSAAQYEHALAVAKLARRSCSRPQCAHTQALTSRSELIVRVRLGKACGDGVTVV